MVRPGPAFAGPGLRAVWHAPCHLLELGALREGAKADDDFLALLEYDGFRVTLAAGTLVAEPTPRFRIHGTQGSFVKYGLDPQEDRLKAGESPTPLWGEDSQHGVLTLREGEGKTPHWCAVSSPPSLAITWLITRLLPVQFAMEHRSRWVSTMRYAVWHCWRRGLIATASGVGYR